MSGLTDDIERLLVVLLDDEYGEEGWRELGSSRRIARILASRERAAEVRALREAADGYEAVIRNSSSFGGAWLRDRADHIEGGNA